MLFAVNALKGSLFQSNKRTKVCYRAPGINILQYSISNVSPHIDI